MVGSETLPNSRSRIGRPAVGGWSGSETRAEQSESHRETCGRRVVGVGDLRQQRAGDGEPGNLVVGGVRG